MKYYDQRQSLRKQRRGSILIISLLLLTAMIAIAALAIEIGVMSAAKNETQRASDAAALAGMWEYQDKINAGSTNQVAMTSARTAAKTVGTANQVYGSNPVLDLNANNGSSGNIVFGNISSYDSGSSTFLPTTTNPNAIKVVINRTAQQNGEVSFCFAKLLGINSKPFYSESVVAMVREVRGFQIRDGNPVNVLPFVLKLSEWNNIVAGVGPDAYSFNESTRQITLGADGVPEANIFPQTTNSAGNSGTVDIGNPNNSTADLSRQILYGINQSDLSYMGGKLEIGSNGYIDLNGDTGISAGIKDELAAIIGRDSVIGIYTSVTGNGNNAQFRVVKWAGVRILAVDLTGSKKANKKVIIQPSNVVMTNIIPGGATSTVDYSDKIMVAPFIIK